MFLFLSLILFALAMYAVYQRTLALGELRPELAGRAIAMQVGEKMRDVRDEGNHVAHFATAVLATGTAKMIRDVIDTRTMFAAIYFVTPDGHVVWSMLREGVSSTTPIFSLDESKNVTYGSPWKDEGGASFIDINYPVFAENRAVAGHVVAQFDLTVLWSTLTSQPEVGAQLVDKMGRSFLSSDNSVKFDDENGGLMTQLLAEKSGATQHTLADGRAILVTSSPIPDFPWTVITWGSYDRVLDMMRGVVYVGFLILGFIVILARYHRYTFNRHLFSPLLEITGNAKKISSGNLSAWVAPGIDNELSDLASALDLLAFKLRWLSEGQEELIKHALSQAKADEDEAERLNTFMVHRELKMSELKDEIRKLRESDNSTPRVEVGENK